MRVSRGPRRPAGARSPLCSWPSWAARATFLTALGNDDLARRAGAELRAHGVEVEAVIRDLPQRRAVALLDARGERTIAVMGDRLVRKETTSCLGIGSPRWTASTSQAGDAGSLRAAGAAGTLVATPRAGDALTGSDVTLDALVFSAGDEGEQDVRERRGWSARVTVATRGPDGGTYTAIDGRTAPSRPPRSPDPSWTPTEPATHSRPGSPSASAREWTSRRPWRSRHAVARET